MKENGRLDQLTLRVTNLEALIHILTKRVTEAEKNLKQGYITNAKDYGRAHDDSEWKEE